MDLNPESIKTIGTQILAQNLHTWGKDARIGHMGWLIRPRAGKREASVVIEFLHPEDANQAIRRGMI
jgi:aspartate aminotransferase-like enzyme